MRVRVLCLSLARTLSFSLRDCVCLSLSLQIQEQPAGVLDLLLDALEECHRLAPINDAVVVGKSHIHHRADFNFSVDYVRPFDGGVHPQNSALRLVDNRGRHHGAENATVRNGEGASRHILQSQISGSRLFAEVIDGALNVRKTHALHVTQHWHYETVGRRHGHAHVNVVTVHHVVAVDDCIHNRGLLQGPCRGSHEHRHEAQFHVVLLHELVLVQITHLDD
mmetsp:Transcript_72386/g.117430  ORF Transcript_72386/g.117430 Transcript_72386/m.117430 type:complete len:222 (+) Transcript_72386:339-1004(+)